MSDAAMAGMKRPASTTISISEARAALPALVDRVANGEEITLTRHGQPVAVVIRPDALCVRRGEDAVASAAALRERLRAARQVARPAPRACPAGAPMCSWPRFAALGVRPLGSKVAAFFPSAPVAEGAPAVG